MSQVQGEEGKSQRWTNLMEQFLDNLFGKDMSVTYEFDDFSIDLSNAEISKGRKLGSGQWKINGKITVNAAAGSRKEGKSSASISNQT